jgi:hypothetical protein
MSSSDLAAAAAAAAAAAVNNDVYYYVDSTDLPFRYRASEYELRPLSSYDVELDTPRRTSRTGLNYVSEILHNGVAHFDLETHTERDAGGRVAVGGGSSTNRQFIFPYNELNDTCRSLNEVRAAVIKNLARRAHLSRPFWQKMSGKGLFSRGYCPTSDDLESLVSPFWSVRKGGRQHVCIPIAKNCRIEIDNGFALLGVLPQSLDNVRQWRALFKFQCKLAIAKQRNAN